MSSRRFVVYDKGRKAYVSCGRMHREDGPAVEWENGRSVTQHELQGHLIYNVAWLSGVNSWWLNGKLIPVSSQEEFERYLEMIAFE